MWGVIAFEGSKNTKNAPRSILWKESKDVNAFICWARRCQTHREDVARNRSGASAAEQGVPGSLPSWLGGVELSEDENTECFKLTMKHILERELTPDQRRKSHYQWDPHGTIGPSNKARSLHDAILHKHPGHKNTAHHIYQHGLPRLLAASGRRDATRRVKSGRRRTDPHPPSPSWLHIMHLGPWARLRRQAMGSLCMAVAAASL